MTDKMTAEQAFEWLLEHVRGNGRANKMPMNPQLRNQLAGIVRQALTAPRVPEGWRLYADDNGVICVENLASGGSILVPTYSDQGDLWMRVTGQFFRALLTAAPAPDDEPLTCDTCGTATDNPWHYSSGERRHLHACDACWRSVNPANDGKIVPLMERVAELEGQDDA